MAGKGLPQVGQKNGKEMLELLQGISGAFRPGILTCLMVGAPCLHSSCKWLLVARACCCTSCWVARDMLMQLGCAAGSVWSWENHPHGRAGRTQDRSGSASQPRAPMHAVSGITLALCIARHRQP